jgi:hypothetical protein
MSNTNVTKKLIEFDVLASPVCLNMNDFLVKKALNMALELQENIKDIIFPLKEI